MTSILPKQNTVTLNLFQGLSIFLSSGLAAKWMLKQVQHDEVGEVN
jgi:hypothetical protein